MAFETKLLEGAHYIANNDSKMAKLVKRYGSPTIRPHSDYYSELVTSIVGQQLSIKAAAAIWQRVLILSGGSPPTPKQLLALDEDTLRTAGLSRPKIRYVKDLAEHILDGRLDMDHIANLPDDEIISKLTAVKGIGEWSAHMFMLFGLGRLDILPWGDLGIRKAAMNVYNLNQMPDKETLVKLSKKHKWSPYQSIASWYLWKSLENEGIRIKKDA